MHYAQLFRKDSVGNWEAIVESTNVSSPHDAKFNFGSIIQMGDRIVLDHGKAGIWEQGDLELERIARGSKMAEQMVKRWE